MIEPIVGVLALQGDFNRHCQTLKALKVAVKEIRKPQELKECKGLIIPGGESTVMLKHMQLIGLDQAILEFGHQFPVFGTCAGLILMSKQIELSPLHPLGLLDITVERNAFGRQVDSFKATIELAFPSNDLQLFEAYFIRAPRIRHYQETVEILGLYKGEPVLVRQGHHLGASFHPELTRDPLIHQLFMQIVYEKASMSKS